MSYEDYRSALRLGQKEYRACVSQGKYPYLQVLDDLLDFADVAREEDLGLVTIPMDQIVGTKGEGRHNVFARNFMPLLKEDSEFASKWMRLCTAHLEEGIRDPVAAYEFMNRFYIQEGNKRVSVLKFFGALTVQGKVIRVIPRRRDTMDSQIYYEFLDFYRLTKVNYVWFSQPGRFKKLLSIVKTDDPVWSDDDRSSFLFAYDQFRRMFWNAGGQKLPATEGDAFLVYCKLYGYEPLKKYQEPEIRANLIKSWKEIAAQTGDEPVSLELSPVTAPSPKSILTRILGSRPAMVKAAFIHEKTSETSGWTYGHEQGRKKLEKALPGRVETCSYDGVMLDEAQSVIEKALREGADVVFTTTPKFLKATLRAALEHPLSKFLNCSLYTPYPTIRTYYGRMYETKFLSGVIAGALTGAGRIGYMADYPIYGAAASINAFALGAQLVNPRARVYLEWTSCRNVEGIYERFSQVGVDVVSNQDRLSPRGQKMDFGLYCLQNGETRRVAVTMWNWGKFYELILRNILDGSWKGVPEKEPTKAINYWWGMSAGVVDIHYSRNLPIGTKRLVELLRASIISGAFYPFSGPLYSQEGQVQMEGDMTPEGIVKMDWLARNVEGAIPAAQELTAEARRLVGVQGIRREEEEEEETL